jgi:hypothetical protein
LSPSVFNAFIVGEKLLQLLLSLTWNPGFRESYEKKNEGLIHAAPFTLLWRA